MKKGFIEAHVSEKVPILSKEKRERARREKTKETFAAKEAGRKISELRKSIDFFAGRSV